MGAKGSNRAANQKGTRCFRANPSGKKRSDCLMIDCGAFYVVLSINDAQSEKRVVRKTKN